MSHEARIFPENTARQIVALEVAGSSPVGHPIQQRDALAPDIRRFQGVWRFERDVFSSYAVTLLPDLQRRVRAFRSHTHKKHMVSSSARDC
jgi:DICT domain-containing protein